MSLPDGLLVGILCQNDVVLTSMRRYYVESPLIRLFFTSYARWVMFTMQFLRPNDVG